MPSKRNNIRHNHNYTNNPPPPMTVSASLSPPPCSQMRPTIANRCTIKSIIDFHRSRLEHPSQGGDIIASLRCRWKIKETAGWWWRHPHSPTQFRPIRSNPTNAKTSWIDFIACFGYDAAISGEMIRRHHHHGKTYSLLGGGGDIPHSPTRFLPNQSHRTIA